MRQGLTDKTTVHYASAVCAYCHARIFDRRDLSGAADADWCDDGEDFGCDLSPDTSDDGCGSHVPMRETERCSRCGDTFAMAELVSPMDGSGELHCAECSCVEVSDGCAATGPEGYRCTHHENGEHVARGTEPGSWAESWPIDPAPKAKHTPGPWHVGMRQAHHIVYDATGWAIADATVYHGKRNEQTLANARLIAAAPALVEALRAFDMFAVGVDLSGSDVPAYLKRACADIHRRARAAIAKAEGGTR